MKHENRDDIFWPRKVSFWDLWLLSAWAFISGLIWSVILLLIVLLTSWIIDIPGSFSSDTMNFWWNSAIFPFILSIVTFFVTIIVSYAFYFFSSFIDPLKYKKSLLVFTQIALFSIITYIAFTPIYIYTWMVNYNDIMLIFIIHVLFLSFWISLLLEILNNYRYVLLWFYASLVWLIVTWVIILLIFFSFENWFAKLISLLAILPIVNWLLIFFKWLFELLYYSFFKITWADPMWDIFAKLEEEEKEDLAEAMDENTTY